ncbi:MAG: preprotein translocase subunit SecE [Candidatus Omnitrophota bacterium]
MTKVGKFLNQVRTELKKVSWPSREEIISSTIVVLTSSLLLAVFIGVCDVVLSRVVNFLISGVF